MLPPSARYRTGCAPSILEMTRPGCRRSTTCTPDPPISRDSLRRCAARAQTWHRRVCASSVGHSTRWPSGARPGSCRGRTCSRGHRAGIAGWRRCWDGCGRLSEPLCCRIRRLGCWSRGSLRGEGGESRGSVSPGKGNRRPRGYSRADLGRAPCCALRSRGYLASIGGRSVK